MGLRNAHVNGWWRILIVIMALILSGTGYVAVTGSDFAGRAELPYDPPNPHHIADPFEAALSCGASCEAYDREHNLTTRREAMRIAGEKGCISASLTFEADAKGITVMCRTKADIAHMVLQALVVCAAIAIAGLTIGWVAGGFKGSKSGGVRQRL